MRNRHSDWIFNLGLKVAVLICLSTLAVALFTGVGPLTAIFRSGTAFTVFVTLGWAATIVWQVPDPKKQTPSDKPAAPAEDDRPPHRTQPESAFEPFTPESI